MFSLDGGSSVHIVTDNCLLVKYILSPPGNKLTQICGTKSQITGIVILSCFLGGLFLILQDVQNMPWNLRISLSLGRLKCKNDFSGTPHDISMIFRHRVSKRLRMLLFIKVVRVRFLVRSVTLVLDGSKSNW